MSTLVERHRAMLAVSELPYGDMSTSCFEEHMIYEFPVWRVCCSPRCGRIFRFGDPETCPVCFTRTATVQAPPRPDTEPVTRPNFKHGDYAYRHGFCKCVTCRDAHRVSVAEKRSKKRAV